MGLRPPTSPASANPAGAPARAPLLPGASGQTGADPIAPRLAYSLAVSRPITVEEVSPEVPPEDHPAGAPRRGRGPLGHVMRLLGLVAGLPLACADSTGDTLPVVDLFPARDAGGMARDAGSPSGADASTPDGGVVGRDVPDLPDLGDLSDVGPADFGTGGPNGFNPRPGTVPINFAVDDSANRSYSSNDFLALRGSFSWEVASRTLTPADPGGPFPLLFDDGPWTEGGHEPVGALAGDNIWGITAFINIPGQPLELEYGLIRGAVGGLDNPNGRIWPPSGLARFVVPVVPRAPIDLETVVIPPWDNIDLRLTLDMLSVDPAFGAGFDPARDNVTVRLSRLSELVPLRDDGEGGDQTAEDRVYTFVLLEAVGPGTPFPHDRGLRPGETVRFTFQIADQDYVGPVDVGGMTRTAALTAGVQARMRDADSSPWVRSPIGRDGPSFETSVTAP